MNLRSRNRVSPDFNMSSMTDIVFLLLIFFMLTSSVVTPTGLPVSLPSSQSSAIVMEKVSVTITPDLKYHINDQPVALQDMKGKLAVLLQNAPEGQGSIVLNVDKSVPVEYLVNVASIATELKAKVTLATTPQE